MTKILVAPLNWGLGHASRCIPIIRSLENLGVQVCLASDGSALRLLQAEFPHLPAFELPSYRIRYQTKSMVWNIARQLPRITLAIRTEQWATEKLVRDHGIQAIISDNRYGCFSKKIPSVLLSHQIHLMVPNAALQWLTNQALRRALAKFDTIWVPDAAGEPNLAGALSHPELRGFDMHYLGLLSRFSPPGAENNSIPADFSTARRIAVVLSGPEPQRTFLEQILMEQAMVLPHKFVFVKGKTHLKEHQYVSEHVEAISYLTATELNELLNNSDVVVCRSGYSSLMDLAVFAGKKAVLIPTPGQTEQEYLAENLAAQGVFVCKTQEKIDLEQALELLDATTGFPAGQFNMQAYELVLQEWLGRMGSRR